MNTNAGNLQKGEFIIFQNDIWQITKTSFYAPGKGAALMRTSLKNLKNGKIINFTFKSNETVEIADIDSMEMQYLYKDDTSLYLMNEKTYDQFQLDRQIVGNLANFLKEGSSLIVFMYQDQPVSLRPPKAVKLKVTESEESAKGNTVNNPRKVVKMETGVKVTVPLFIKQGDLISLDPETGSYLGRIKE